MTKFKTKPAIRQLETQEGLAISENREKANLSNNYFASVFQKAESELLPDFGDRQFIMELNTTDVKTERNSKSSRQNRIKSSKSQGSDNIHPMIKECRNALQVPLRLLQSILVISNSKGLTKILRDIRTSTYQS